MDKALRTEYRKLRQRVGLRIQYSVRITCLADTLRNMVNPDAAFSPLTILTLIYCVSLHGTLVKAFLDQYQVHQPLSLADHPDPRRESAACN